MAPLFKLFVLALTVFSLHAIAAHEGHDHSHDDMDDFDDVGPESTDADVEDNDDIELVAPKEKPKPRERPLYSPPVTSSNVHFSDAFESESSFNKRWVLSRAKKDNMDESIAKYDGKWNIEEPADNPLRNDLGLVLKSRAKHHAVAAKLTKPFDFSGSTFVIQYEVKFQNGQECGGGYIKLLSNTDKLDLGQFNDQTGYTIMFGPDKCGNDHKLHFIFRHKNPITGKYEEKHAKKPSASIDSFFTDKRTHLYTLVVKSDNTFEILVDQNLVNSGSLLEDMTPPVNPPKEISDPSDKKPADWDDKERIVDPDAKKPEDWDESEPEKIPDENAEKPEGWLDDEPELIPDPNAEKPSDWDDDMDGEWEAAQISNPKCESGPGCGNWKAPMVDNPKYKGKWSAPLIDNPNYKGKWSARMIPNPDYFEDLHPFKMTPIGAIGFELWSMSDDILFDNIIITDDRSAADRWAADSWELKNEQEKLGSDDGGVVQSVIEATNEHPWLWAVIIVVIVLPIVLLVVCCCMPSSKTPSEEARVRHKKTDEMTPDDEGGDDEDDGEPGSEEEISPDTASGGNADADMERDEEEVEEEAASKDVKTDHAEQRKFKKTSKTTLESPEKDNDSSVLHDTKKKGKKL